MSNFNDINKVLRYLLPILIGSIIWFLPAPETLDPKALQMLAIFIATITAIIVTPLPMSALALIGGTVAVTLDAIAWKDLYSSNGTNLVWLVLMAFFISKGIIKSQLGHRIALFFIKLLGKKTIGLGYGLAFTDFVLSPAMPSITARAGGVMLPISRSISEALGSYSTDETKNKLGSYLVQTAFLANIVTASMFITAMAGNPLAVKLAADQGVELSWLGWATAALVPGLICLLLTPLLTFYLNKPSITETPGAAKLAKEKLAEMGSVSKHEWIAGGIFVALILLWVLGKKLFGIGSGHAATLGVCAMLLTGVIKWSDALEEKSAWDTMIWIGILIMMAGKLNSMGLIAYFGDSIGSYMEGGSKYFVYTAIAALYLYIHYFFASATAHIGALYAISLSILIASGVNPFMGAITLACLSNIYGCLTPYAIGSAPVMFGSGYVSKSKWLRNGFIMSVVYLTVYLTIGPIWWNITGQL